MISDFLIPALQSEFAGWEVTFGTPPYPIATFPSCQPDVGKLLVYDDGDEARVLIEKVTHGHFNAFNEKLDPQQRDRIIAEDVLNFLKALLNDRILLHTYANQQVGGWTRLKDGPVEFSQACRLFLWSRPYEA